MKVILSVLLFAGVSLSQVCSGMASRHAFETAASASNTQVFWSEEVGRLESGETYADFIAFSVANPADFGHQLRGIRLDLGEPGHKQVVYIESMDVAALRSRADWLARSAKKYPNETHPFVVGGARDDPRCPFDLTYQHSGNDSILYLRTTEPFHQFAFAGAAPSDLVTILDRAAKALKR